MFKCEKYNEWQGNSEATNHGTMQQVSKQCSQVTYILTKQSRAELVTKTSKRKIDSLSHAS